jgi:hypothetical protein
MGNDALKAANEQDCFWQVHGLVDHVTRQAKIYWQMGLGGQARAAAASKAFHSLPVIL